MSDSDGAAGVQLAVIFSRPPGWPQPSDVWQICHQGWTPPPGFSPHPDAPDAPRNWVFWTKAPLGVSLVKQFRGNSVGWMIIGIILFCFGLLSTIAGVMSSSVGGGYVVFWGALVYGPIAAIRAGIRIRAAEKKLLVEVTRYSAEVKDNMDRADYNRYLQNIGAGQ